MEASRAALSPAAHVEASDDAAKADIINFPSQELLELKSQIPELNIYSNVIVSRAQGFDTEENLKTDLVGFNTVSDDNRSDVLLVRFKSCAEKMIFAEILDEFEFLPEPEAPTLGLFQSGTEGTYRLTIYECDQVINPDFAQDPELYFAADRLARRQFLEFLREKNYFRWFPEP